MAELEGQVALITGASGGLGRAVVRAFLDAGARVATIQSAGAEPGVFSLAADLTAANHAAQAVSTVQAHFGRIDALVHLVGGFEGGATVEQIEDRSWTRMFDLNVNSAFYMIRAVLPGMLAGGRGRILAIGSRMAVEPAAALAAYNASKAALVSLIHTVALEVRQRGLTANAVLPSVIDTPANRAAMPQADATKWVQPAAIARLLVWLASDAAADVNGAAIPIYGRA
jgi:NAD(P)-dependent dehydrogenase (short-subunit alcohol dehydrogenase family)